MENFQTENRPRLDKGWEPLLQVNEFQDGLVSNRCNRSFGLTLKLTAFDVTPSVISSCDRIAAGQYLFFFYM